MQFLRSFFDQAQDNHSGSGYDIKDGNVSVGWDLRENTTSHIKRVWGMVKSADHDQISCNTSVYIFFYMYVYVQYRK